MVEFYFDECQRCGYFVVRNDIFWEVLAMAGLCRIPCWPIRPFFGSEVLLGILAVAGFVFSLVMLVDCLRRPREKFYYQLTRDAEYDRLIWAVAIVLSFSFYFLGAIVYFFVVHRARPEESGQEK